MINFHFYFNDFNRSSETGLCYYATDYAEEQPKQEFLAVRFKLKETKDDFRKVFESCQEAIRQRKAGNTSYEAQPSSYLETASATPKVSTASPAVVTNGSGKEGSPSNKAAGQGDKKSTTPEKPLGLFTPSSSASSIFGSSTGSATFNVFGTPKQQDNNSLFGGRSPSGPAVGVDKSIFGGSVVNPSDKTDSPMGIFGGYSASPASIFGGSASFGDKSKPATATPSLFGGSSSAATGGSGFVFGSSSSSSFGGSGITGFSLGGGKADPSNSSFKASPFKAAAPVITADDNAAADGADPEDEHHDPHFEPIIPLPELVNVTTGEEEEAVLFQHRAKLYRYQMFDIAMPIKYANYGQTFKHWLYISLFRFDSDEKAWKEKGLGDLKILEHPDKKKFRVLLRREQVHKIACNHYISKEMSFDPLKG